MSTQDFSSCWYCDNIINHPDQVGLMYLGFPRCFVLIPNSRDFVFSTFDEFRSGLVKINWLDPSDVHNYTEQEKQDVLITLWNFSVEQERKEDRLAGERDSDMDF